MRKSYVFTSESVSEGHPDKVCDRISDEVVDLFFREGAKAGIDAGSVRVACETLATTNRVVIAGETRGPAAITRDYVAHLARLAVKESALNSCRLVSLAEQLTLPVSRTACAYAVAVLASEQGA